MRGKGDVRKGRIERDCGGDFIWWVYGYDNGLNKDTDCHDDIVTIIMICIILYRLM